MAPRVKTEEEKIITNLPDEVKVLKVNMMDYVFSKAQADYYFSLLFGLDIKRSQRRTEELFRKGALIKIHSERDAKPTLYPAPPSFMFFIDDLGMGIIKKHKAVIEKLEDLYFQRFCATKDSFLKQKQVFFTAKGKFMMGFLAFLIKKNTKTECQMTFMDIDKQGYKQLRLALGDDIIKKTTALIPSHNNTAIMKEFKELKIIDKDCLSKERLVIIDEHFLMHYFSLKDLRNNRFITGYITHFNPDIKEAKRKFKILYSLARSNKISMS